MTRDELLEERSRITRLNINLNVSAVNEEIAEHIV